MNLVHELASKEGIAYQIKLVRSEKKLNWNNLLTLVESSFLRIFLHYISSPNLSFPVETMYAVAPGISNIIWTAYGNINITSFYLVEPNKQDTWAR